MREIYAEFNLKPLKVFKSEFGFNTNGRVQQRFTQLVYDYSEPYTPRLNGTFYANKDLGPDYIHYLSPQANYLWNGKKFVDPDYGKGAFYSEDYGFWSRPGILKEQTDEPLHYTEEPLRGPHWIDRMWADKSEEIISETEEYMKRGY